MNWIHLDLFSGMGGMTEGLQQAGFKVTRHFFSEIDKHAIANYKYNYNEAEYIGSVTNVRHIIRLVRAARTDERLVITFGSPCQDFSLAGKRGGLGGSKSSLIKYALFLVRWLKPDVFIWENVKGAYSTNAGADYWAIMQAFAHLDGDGCEGQLLNTAWFLPQNRERIYVVGHLTGRSRAGVFPISEDDIQPDEQTGGFQRKVRPDRIAACLTARMHKCGATDNYIKVTSATNAGYEEAGIGDSINFSVPNSQTRRGRVGKGVAQTLDTACNQGVITIVGNIYPSGHEAGNIYDKEGISPTIKCNGPRPNMKNIAPKVDTAGIRRLTEIECERLQGFADNWTQYGIYDGEVKKIAKTQRYKLCGNAVSVPVVKEIGLRILKNCIE